jgi:acyl dehydratase
VKISGALLGTSAGPLEMRADARWMMAYSAALGERDARCYDTRRPDGVLAHPLFPVCYEWPLVLALRERAGLAALDARVVHAQHDLAIQRAARAGETLTLSARIVAAVQRRPGALVVARLDARDAEGRPVSTTLHGSLYRGVLLEDGAGAAEDAPQASGELSEIAPLEIPATLAHVYSECARIWNPIHTDLSYALAAGLPGLILHGTATLALALSALLAARGAGFEAVRRVRCRFGAPVPLPARLALLARHETGASEFELTRADGERAITRGRVDLV